MPHISVKMRDRVRSLTQEVRVLRKVLIAGALLLPLLAYSLM